MGCVSSNASTFTTEHDQGIKHSKNISEILVEDKRKDGEIHKVLLLGAARSGKTTLFEQLSLIHGDSSSGEGCDMDIDSDTDNSNNSNHRRHINHSKSRSLSSKTLSSVDGKYVQYCTVSSMKQLVRASMEQFKDSLKAESQEAFQLLNDETSFSRLTCEDIADNIALLWNDETIQNTFRNRDNLQYGSFNIIDSCDYFFNNIKRIFNNKGYIPNEQDILLTYKPTKGIDTIHIESGTIKVEIIDIGGIDSQRHKWINYFDNVKAIIFVASLSCYNQFMIYENGIQSKENALVESIQIFNNLVNQHEILLTPIILFLNKSDLFKEKIKEYPLTICFKECKLYISDCNGYDECIKYIEKQFEYQIPNPKDRKLYIHITCATDRDNVKHIFEDVRHFIITNSLEKNGLI